MRVKIATQVCNAAYGRLIVILFSGHYQKWSFVSLFKYTETLIFLEDKHVDHKIILDLYLAIIESKTHLFRILNI